MEKEITKALQGLLLPDLIEIVLEYVPPRLIVDGPNLLHFVQSQYLYFDTRNLSLSCYYGLIRPPHIDNFHFPESVIKSTFGDLRLQLWRKNLSERGKMYRLEIHPDELIVYTQGHQFTLPFIDG